jgi:hypothetical protein
MARGLNEAMWRLLTEEIILGICEWRVQHPKATLREIETKLDARLNRARARMLEDLALQSTVEERAVPARHPRSWRIMNDRPKLRPSQRLRRGASL